MRRFVESSGKLNLPTKVAKKQSIQPERALKDAQLKKMDINTLNQKDRVRIQKEAKRLAEFEALK